MIKYYKFKERNGKELSKFISKNVFFAFSMEQFNEGLKKFNIKQEEVKDKLSMYIGGGYILKDSIKEERKITKKYAKCERKYLSKFKQLKDALRYEMGNHECNYTYCYTDCLAPLGYSIKDLHKNKKLRKAFIQAKNEDIEWYRKREE